MMIDFIHIHAIVIGLVGVGVVLLGLFLLPMLQKRQPNLNRLRRMYPAYRKLKIRTNLVGWAMDNSPIVRHEYVANAHVALVDDEGIVVSWPSPVKPPSGWKRVQLHTSYSWQELGARRRWRNLSAFYYGD